MGLDLLIVKSNTIRELVAGVQIEPVPPDFEEFLTLTGWCWEGVLEGLSFQNLSTTHCSAITLVPKTYLEWCMITKQGPKAGGHEWFARFKKAWEYFVERDFWVEVWY